MARRTDSRRTAAKPKMPAKRSPTRSNTASGASRSQGPDERAALPGPAGLAASETADSPTPEQSGESASVAMPEPEASAAATAVTGGDAALGASPDEPPAAPPEPAAAALTEQVAGVSAAGALEDVAPAGALERVAPAGEPARAAAEEVSAATAALAPGRNLVEGTIDMHGRMVAFACRQTEFGLATGRALLASRSLPEMVSLQSAFVGRSVENVVAHTLELTRLSAEILREGLRAPR